MHLPPDLSMHSLVDATFPMQWSEQVPLLATVLQSSVPEGV
jgi:hypothetical protein